MGVSGFGFRVQGWRLQGGLEGGLKKEALKAVDGGLKGLRSLRGILKLPRIPKPPPQPPLCALEPPSALSGRGGSKPLKATEKLKRGLKGS